MPIRSIGDLGENSLNQGNLLHLLECPRDHAELQVEHSHLRCTFGHSYPVANGIPVFLLAEKSQTIGIARASLKAAESAHGAPLYLDTLGLSNEEKYGIARDWVAGSEIDPAISYLIGATSGWGYANLIGKLKSYPIPDIPVGQGNGKLLLDVGSNWGRWSISAARKGWKVIAIEPSLGAIFAAQRAFSNWGMDISFVCGDARFLPFKSNSFQSVFSYSVLQHFSGSDAQLSIAEMSRVLSPGGFAKIQMAHKGGLRSTYWRTRPNYAAGGDFRVRYWSLASMRHVYEKNIGPTRFVVEAFGGLGLLTEDIKYVSIKAKFLIVVSTILKRVAAYVRPLIYFADSVYVISSKQ